MKTRDTTSPVKQEFIVERAADSESGNPRIKITTQKPDRMGDIVVAAGMNAKNYMKNPVVLYGHNSHSGYPVGKTISLTVVDGKHVESEFKWAPTDQAQMVKELYDGGFLNAASIGFLPDYSKAEELPAPEGSWFPPLKFHEWELLEWSIVPVPANAGALRLAITEYDAGRKEMLDAILKSGRVLSAANENSLKDARDLLDKVLASVQTAPEPDDAKSAGSIPSRSHSDPESIPETPATPDDSDPLNFAASIARGLSVLESVGPSVDEAIRAALADALGIDIPLTAQKEHTESWN